MAEYINKAELKSEGICMGIMCSECSFNNNFKDEVCKLSRYIDELPTIDIVHCKDCKCFCTSGQDGGVEYCGELLREVHGNWFCADGRRSDE